MLQDEDRCVMRWIAIIALLLAGVSAEGEKYAFSVTLALIFLILFAWSIFNDE